MLKEERSFTHDYLVNLQHVALELAKSLSHEYVKPIHLLYAMTRVDDGRKLSSAKHVLEKNGITSAVVEEYITQKIPQNTFLYIPVENRDTFLPPISGHAANSVLKRIQPSQSSINILKQFLHACQEDRDMPPVGYEPQRISGSQVSGLFDFVAKQTANGISLDSFLASLG